MTAATRRIASRDRALALLIYTVAAIGLFGQPFAHPSRHECLCITGTTDESVYVWAFQWWPHALIHGLNPFYTQLLYAPQGINLAHGTTVPGAAMLLWPVTTLAGPLIAFNLAMLLAPILAAWFAFLLCRRVTGSFGPSLIGGWLFGFSTYMLGQLTSHLHLVLVFPVPAIVLVVLRGLAGELTRTRLTALLTALLLLELSFSLEVLASLTLFGAVALAVTYLMQDAAGRTRVRGVLVSIALAYLVTAIATSPYLYYALKPGGVPVLAWRSDKFAADLLAYVIPNTWQQLGGLSFASLSKRFTAYAVEGSAYLGIPLLAMVVLGFASARRRVEARVAALMLGVLVLCSLGARLNVGGPTRVPLPWALVHNLPVLGLILPARLAVYVALIAAVLAAMWLASSHARWRWLLAGAALASLWPAVSRNYWRSIPEQPAFFRAGVYRQALHDHDTVLVLPVGIAGQSMLWHAEANLGFTMAGGYVTAPEAPDPYQRFAVYPMLTYFARVPRAVGAAAQFLHAEAITVVVLDRAAAAFSPWVPVLERLGWRPRALGGVLVMRPAMLAVRRLPAPRWVRYTAPGVTR